MFHAEQILLGTHDVRAVVFVKVSGSPSHKQACFRTDPDFHGTVPKHAGPTTTTPTHGSFLGCLHLCIRPQPTY